MDSIGSGGDDAALVAAWRRGDTRVARRVVRLHGPAMTRVALALCPRAEDAEDVVQDALLRAHRSIHTFDARQGSLRSWLVAVTANRARQVRRDASRYLRFLARLKRESYTAVDPVSPHGALSFARKRLAELPPREREAFVLVEIEELTSKQAARAMGISDSTVRVLVSRARDRIREEPVVEPTRLQVEGRQQ